MKAFIYRLTLVTFLAISYSAFGQFNIVGYVNRPIVPGQNLVANQLDATPNNTINNVLLNVANGATFTKWDPVANIFLPQSVFNLGTHTWSINYSLNLGEGALVNSPSLTTNTFVGSVANYTNIIDLGPGGGVWAPNYADGLHLISCPVPIGGPISTMFSKVVSRTPEAGEWVSIFDENSQTYVTATFDGVAWDNDPELQIAHAAWFNLGPVNVPEPSALALGLTAMAFCFARRRKR